MQKPSELAPVEGPKPKRALRWRELSDEQQWEHIYEGRKQKEAVRVKNPAQAAALALPSYCLHMAIDDCHQTFQATIRGDVHTAILTSMARVSAMLPERKRETMLNRMHAAYGKIKSAGFYLNNREFLYVNACALGKLVDDYRFPPDAPVVPAAILLKEDAETDEVGDWNLDVKHAVRMTGLCYDQYLATELYRYPESKIDG